MLLAGWPDEKLARSILKSEPRPFNFEIWMKSSPVQF